MRQHAERALWGAEFPEVVRNGDLGSLKAHPSYAAAKRGDPEAALQLVGDLMGEALVEGTRALAPAGERSPVLVPVIAREEQGRNWIPLMVAEVLAHRLGWATTTDIVQVQKIARTGKGADYRLIHQPAFDGEVEVGQRYVLLDDSLSMGGTLASLRGYIENRGGRVVGAGVMTAHPGALRLPVSQKMLHAIDARHGPAMSALCEEYLGYGVELLTQGEAGHFKSARSVEAMRKRLEDQLSTPTAALFLAETGLFLDALAGQPGAREQAWVKQGRQAIGRHDVEAVSRLMASIRADLVGARLPPLLAGQLEHAQRELECVLNGAGMPLEHQGEEKAPVLRSLQGECKREAEFAHDESRKEQGKLQAPG